MSGKKRKGMSLDDKRDTILKIYHERKEPLNLKEIENYGSKKGVVQQTIKEVNQSLIDDHQVQTDKIGSGNFFWAFPAKAYQDLLAQKEGWSEAQATSLENIEKINADIATERVHRSGNEREAKMKQLQQLLQDEKILNQRLEELKGNDPEEIERVERETKRCKVGADLWTDNIYAIKSYLTRKKGMNSKEVDRMLGIDGSFDYVS
jgi:hypothetical protein